MTTTVKEARPCPNCGKPLPTAALAGLCPACLLAQGGETVSELNPPSRFVPPPLETIAKLFPQLEMLGLLGAGGMGAVYKARQPALDRVVALKVLPAKTGGGGNFAERFNREARALARLSHPNIVAVYEFGEAGDLRYFVMEFVDGANLRQLERSNRLSPREALQLIPQICDALQYANDEGVVHRDIKPENVLVDRKGRVKIADFGLARIVGQEPDSSRLTRDGQVMGTPHYMAPEQVAHTLAVDHRADIYSLGVVLYELLTGDLPMGHFPPPSRKVHVDIRFDEVVLRALENDPERRYQQARDVKTEVETIASTSSAAPIADRAASPTGLGRWWRWAFALAAFVLAGFGIYQDTPLVSKLFNTQRSQAAVPDQATGALVARLPGGRSIELLAVAEADSAPDQWWQPNGVRITNATFQVHGPADMLTRNVLKRQMAFKTEGLGVDTDSLVFESEPVSGISAGGQVFKDGEIVPGGLPLRVAWPVTARSGSIRIGYPADSWRTVVTHVVNAAAGGDLKHRNDPAWRANLNNVTDDGTDTQVTVVLGPNPKRWKTRILAVDNDDVIHTPRRSSATALEHSTTWSLTFAGLIEADIKEIQVQVRPLHWVTFPDTALTPRDSQLAAVQEQGK